jgi:hypothetical protein
VGCVLSDSFCHDAVLLCEVVSVIFDYEREA